MPLTNESQPSGMERSRQTPEVFSTGLAGHRCHFVYREGGLANSLPAGILDDVYTSSRDHVHVVRRRVRVGKVIRRCGVFASWMFFKNMVFRTCHFGVQALGVGARGAK